MAFIVLAPAFVVLIVVCLWTFREAGPIRYILALCVALLCLLGVARRPGILAALQIPYQALALALLLMGILWILNWGVQHRMRR